MLQDMRAEIKMQLQQAGAQPHARSLRRIPRSGAQLRWNAPIREGPEKAQGVDRTAVWRGQKLARDEEVLLEEARKGEHRSLADRLRPERQAAARLRRPETEESGSGGSPAPAGRYLRPRGQSCPEAPREALPVANEGIFQHAGRFLGQTQRLVDCLF